MTVLEGMDIDEAEANTAAATTGSIPAAAPLSKAAGPSIKEGNLRPGADWSGNGMRDSWSCSPTNPALLPQPQFDEPRSPMTIRCKRSSLSTSMGRFPAPPMARPERSMRSCGARSPSIA